jgi:G:T/U-mismatch repair DNA glycosylase
MPDLLPDIIGPKLLVLFCGINPGAQAAASGHHFVGRGNRFWKTLHLAGFTPYQIDPQNDRRLLKYGCGLTTVVARATARADQVAKHEFVGASGALQHSFIATGLAASHFSARLPTWRCLRGAVSSGGCRIKDCGAPWFGCCPIRAGSIVGLVWTHLSMRILCCTRHCLR